MLNYTTGDIIRRARELADLQNSDFISWEENMHLLDESYKKLYQEVINANDKFYLTTITPSDLVVESREEKEVRYSLPSNFYQLHSIVGRVDSVPVMKKALSEGKSSMRYDIINNSLVLYGGVESHDIVINYYPIPKTLTLRAPDVKIQLMHTPISCNGTRYLTYGPGTSETELHFYVEDISIGEIIADFTFSAVGFNDAFIGKRIVGFINDEGVTYYDYINKQWGYDHTAHARYAIRDDFAYIVHPGADYYEFYKENMQTPSYKINVVSEAFNSWFKLTFDDNSVYGFFNNYVKRWYTTGVEDVAPCSNTDLLVNTNGVIWWYDGINIIRNGIPFCKELDILKVIGLNKVDFNTGYGLSVETSEDSSIHVISCFSDTELNFPNNFYFNFLAYQLAIAYKSKQNADVTMLLQQAGEEKAHFYDSLSRDAAENCRIQNVYSNGGMF